MHIARFNQVALTDDEGVNNYSAACGTGVQRGGYCWFLSWSLDSLDDHFVCSYVLVLVYAEGLREITLLFCVSCSPGAASFTIYSRTKEYCAEHKLLCRPHMFDAALTGGISGAMSGSLISFGSARKLSLGIISSSSIC